MKTPGLTFLLLLGVLARLSAPFPAGAQESNAGTDSNSLDAAMATNAASAVITNAEEPVSVEAESEDTNRTPVFRRSHRGGGEPIVVFGRNVELKAGQTAEAVVVIGGDVKIDGKVKEAVVAIMGNVEVNGEVGDAVVAVLGGVKAGGNAQIHGDAVAVGGRVEAAPGAVISGQSESVDWEAYGLPRLDWIKDWLRHCVFKLRPLAPQVKWVWTVAAVTWFFYFLVAAIFARPVQVCVDELTRRPTTTFLIGLLTIFLTPIASILLAVTGIGLIVVPFILAVLFFAGVVGKVALLEWIGFRIGSHFGGDANRKPLIGFLIGSLVILVLYVIPILGFLTMILASTWAVGCAITAAFGGIRRESPPRPEATPPTGLAPVPPAVPGSGSSPSSFGSPAAAIPAMPLTNPAGPEPFEKAPETFAVAAGGTATDVLTAPVLPPVLPEALSYPRAGFWDRMGADFLDIVLVSIVSGFVGSAPLGLLIWLAYFSGMWAWKGTTIGGIVLGLKVVRQDGQPVTFAVALVRGLAAAFSVIVFFLGFLWIAWDPEKQGWHDRIAGTVVIRLPKGTPLLVV